MHNSMGKYLIILLIGLVSSVCGQNDVCLVPCDFQEIIQLGNYISPTVIDNGSDLVYSRNRLNAISLEVNPSDLNKPLKHQLKIIHLFDRNGNLLASSGPIDLNDWIIKPMGDDNTVLVIFPASTARQVIVRFFKVNEKTLVKENEVERKSSYFNFDTYINGVKLIACYSPYRGISELPQLVVYDNNGIELWAKTIDEKDIYSVSTARDYIVTTSHDLKHRVGYVYLFDYRGNRKMKSRLNDIVGTYQIECSNDSENRFFAICTSSRIELFDSESRRKIKFVESCDDEVFKSFVIDEKGSIIAATQSKIIIETLEGVRSLMSIGRDGNPEIKIDNNNIILKMWNPQKTVYYEIQY